MQHQSDVFETTATLARELGVSESCVRDWTNTGKLDSRRDRNGRRLFGPTEVKQARQLRRARVGVAP